MPFSDSQTSRPQVIGVIPARLASTRLPRKVLREIAGKPLLLWVHHAAENSGVFDRLIVAADSEEVMQLCRRHGIEARMTAPELPSGTDRVHQIAQELCLEKVTPKIGGADESAIFVNIQGDEPLLRAEHFHALLRPFFSAGDGIKAEVSTVMTPCPAQDVMNPNVVKVVANRNGEALYFSRAPIPWDRDQRGDVQYWKHIGLYAYSQKSLEEFHKLPPSALETVERLEQLRLLENGIRIHVEPVEFDTVGVDTEEDLEAVAALLLDRFPAR